MTTQPTCRCDVRERMAPAGEAATLCHHSTRAEIIEARTKLYNIMADLDKDIDLGDLLTRPVTEAVNYYMHTTLGADQAMINQREMNIMRAAFLRHYSMAIQALMTQVLEEVAPD